MITLSYLAGLIDGEGTFIINYYRRKNPTHKNQKGHWYARCSIHMQGKKSFHLLREIQEKYGGTLHKREKGNNDWTLDFCSRKATKLMKKLLPYLQLKKGQAQLLIEFYDKFRDLRFGSKEKYQIEFERRMDLKEHIQMLNQQNSK